jgi:cobalt/nickel transport system permease protein
MIPDWLAAAELSGPPSASGHSARGSFAERTISGTARFLLSAMISEDTAKRGGLFQAIDPRMKLVTVLALIVSVSIMHSPVTIWAMYCLTLLLAAASSVPLFFFIKRVWLFIPLFSAVIVIPAMFNLVTPGEPVWTVFHLAHGYDFGPYHIPETITITRQGCLSAVTFIGRVAASVSLAVLLTLTTLWSDLLRSLSILKVPRLFILILSMAYRYILLLVQTVHDIHVARKSRTLRYGTARTEQQWVASRMGYVFKKTYAMSQDVHNAMLSRGFSGDVKSLAVFKTRNYDYAWGVIVVLMCMTALYFDRVACP